MEICFRTREDDIKIRSREATWTDGLNSVLKITVFWNETLFCLVHGYVLEKHASSIFGQNIRYEDESDYSETLVNIYHFTRRHISVRFSNFKFVTLAAERLNLRGLVSMVIIIQLPHKTDNFWSSKIPSASQFHKITRHYHLRYKCELSLKFSFCVKLKKSQTTQSRIAEDLTKHIHTIILFISVFNQLDAQNCFTISFISCETILCIKLVKYWDKYKDARSTKRQKNHNISS